MIEKGKSITLQKAIEYIDGGIASKQLMKCKQGNITLFAFDKDQGLTEHTTPFDALVQIIEGKAEITIGEVSNMVKSGEIILLPADVPHALFAREKYKMILTMIKCSN